MIMYSPQYIYQEAHDVLVMLTDDLVKVVSVRF